MLQLRDSNNEEEQFWKKPLGAWIKDCVIGTDALLPEAAWRTEACRGRVLRFAELCDGFVFSLLFLLVESDTLNLIVMRDGGENSPSDIVTNLKRLSVLLENIRNFYRRWPTSRRLSNRLVEVAVRKKGEM
ncbi:unnamed protein product [Litomosoides sigmodontis]|uniref:Uncharacterized protein n=1 Tax=Litomosoides sigmodontis TaxID=42156 RepID=A0A3P6TH67_LITSI|nr:unnamed protein product [Litomosoides sigmodontis]